MSDVMLFGVLRMPYEMAMADELSRMQFHSRVGEVLDRLERAEGALREIALAGMSGTGQESEEAVRDWHARRAWEFIGIAARALSAAESGRAK